MGSKTKTGVIIAVCVVCIVAIAGAGVAVFVFTSHNNEDTSMEHTLNKAMANNGSVSIDGWGNTKLNEWQSYGSYYTTYHWIKYKAHLNNDSLVLEIMYSSNSSSNKPTDDGVLTNVHYFSVLDIASITYDENNVTYTWHR